MAAGELEQRVAGIEDGGVNQAVVMIELDLELAGAQVKELLILVSGLGQALVDMGTDSVT